MKKLTSNFRNMAVVLTVICVLAALMLSSFFELTEEQIAESDKKKQEEAIAKVLPFEGMQIKTEKVFVYPDSLTIHRAFVGEEEVGVAVETFSKNGFNGEITLMVGFDSNNNIIDYSVLDQKETPGLGTKMVDWFKPQAETKKSFIETIFNFQVASTPRQSSVIGKNATEPLSVNKDGGNIDAITAATISSRAFLDAINRAFRVLDNNNAEWDCTSGASTMECAESNDTTAIYVEEIIGEVCNEE